MNFGHLGCVGASTVRDSYPLRHSRDNCRSNLHELILEQKYFFVQIIHVNLHIFFAVERQRIFLKNDFQWTRLSSSI